MFLKDKHIFIVEDNVQNRVVFQMALLVHGASVDFERWGRETVRRLQDAHKLDLIILDLMLAGGISGYDIFEEIRRLPKFDAIPIIAVSASEPSSAIARTQKLGFSGFIGKPIDDDHFAEQIAKVIAGEHIWHAGIRF